MVIIDKFITTSDYKNSYHKRIKLKVSFLVLLFILVLLTMFADLILGSQTLTLKEVVKALLLDNEAKDINKLIIWNIRMPASLTAPVLGAILGFVGVQMQTVLNNPLADPYTFGVSSSASFGAGLIMILGMNIPFIPVFIQIPLFAFIVCLITTFFISYMANKCNLSSASISLLGVAIMFAFDAMLTLMQYIASESQLQSLTFWTMGSLTKATWDKLNILLFSLIICFFIIIKKSWFLTALSLGEVRAKSMGININRLRTISLVVVSILASLSVAFVGAVGFVGLVSPHLSKMFIGEDQRFFIIGSTLFGALLLTVSAILSKSLVPGVIFPLTIITSAIGVPFFIFLLIKRKGI